MAMIIVFLVIPAFVRVQLRESRARKVLAEAEAAGRTEPVTIQPWIDPGVCMGSGACVRACPEDVLDVIDGQAVIVDAAACVGHGACEEACPVNAIQLVFGSATRGVDLPQVGPDFETNMPGLFIAGELGGMGLIANAVEQGAQAMEAAARGLRKGQSIRDVVIVGAGPAGLSAAIVAKQMGLDHVLLDQHEFGGAIRHYPRQKLVFSRPIQFRGQPPLRSGTLLKEELVEYLEKVVASAGLQIRENEPVTEVRPELDGTFTVTTEKGVERTQRILLAIGRRGTPRALNVPGEDQEKVAYWLKDAQLYKDQDLLVVGAGDSAVEAACSLGEIEGNRVWLAARGKAVNRPRKKNIERLRDAIKRGRVNLMLQASVLKISPDRVVLDQAGERVVVPNDFVFVCIGGVLPTQFLKKAGVEIRTHHGAASEVEPHTVPSLADLLLDDIDWDTLEIQDNDPGTEEIPMSQADTAVRTPGQLMEVVEALKLSDEMTDPLGLPPPPLEPDFPDLPLAADAPPADEHTVWAKGMDDIIAEALAEDSAHAPGTRRKIEPDYSVPEDTERLLEVLADLVGPLAEGSGSTSIARLKRIARSVRERIPGELAAAASAEALRAAGHIDLEQTASLRVQGLLALRRSDLAEATDRFDRALRAGRERRLEPTDEARTHRWLAEVRAVDNRYRSAATHLWNGVRRLGRDGPAPERAALTARQVEVELDLGRPNDALRAADTLIGLARMHPEHGWMPTACAAVGSVSAMLGDRVVAVTSAVRAADALDALNQRLWRPTVATARLLCSVQLTERAIPLLEGLAESELPHNPLVDPEGQVLAVQARVLAVSNPERAKDLAKRAAARTPAVDRGRAARTTLDLAWTWHLVGEEERASTAAQQGLRLAYPLGAQGLRLELLELLFQVRPDDRLHTNLHKTVAKIARDLPADRAARFVQAHPTG